MNRPTVDLKLPQRFRDRAPKGLKDLLEELFALAGLSGAITVRVGENATGKAERQGLVNVAVIRINDAHSVKIRAQAGSNDECYEMLVMVPQGMVPAECQLKLKDAVEQARRHAKSHPKKEDRAFDPEAPLSRLCRMMSEEIFTAADITEEMSKALGHKDRSSTLGVLRGLLANSDPRIMRGIGNTFIWDPKFFAQCHVLVENTEGLETSLPRHGSGDADQPVPAPAPKPLVILETDRQVAILVQRIIGDSWNRKAAFDLLSDATHTINKENGHRDLRVSSLAGLLDDWSTFQYLLISAGVLEDMGEAYKKGERVVRLDRRLYEAVLTLIRDPVEGDPAAPVPNDEEDETLEEMVIRFTKELAGSLEKKMPEEKNTKTGKAMERNSHLRSDSLERFKSLHRVLGIAPFAIADVFAKTYGWCTRDAMHMAFGTAVKEGLVCRLVKPGDKGLFPKKHGYSKGYYAFNPSSERVQKWARLNARQDARDAALFLTPEPSDMPIEELRPAAVVLAEPSVESMPVITEPLPTDTLSSLQARLAEVEKEATEKRDAQTANTELITHLEADLVDANNEKMSLVFQMLTLDEEARELRSKIERIEDAKRTTLRSALDSLGITPEEARRLLG